MRTLDELPVGAKFQVRQLIDEPELGRKKGDLIWVTWGGTLPSRPTTRWGRAIPRRIRHEPLGPSECACGDTFEDTGDALAHVETWVPAWSRVRFRYDGDNGEQVARPIDGHEMAFDGESVTCACGWAVAAPDLHRAGPVARSHVRAVLRARMDTTRLAV